MQKPRLAATGRGANWILDGLRYFKQSPLAWIAAMIVGFIILIFLSVIPFGSILFNVLSPIFAAGLMLGCKAIDDGNNFRFEHLFAGFKSNKIGQLAILGVIYTVGSLIILILLAIMLFSQLGGFEVLGQIAEGTLDDEALNQIMANSSSLLLTILIGMTLFLPLIMGIWFAPALVVFENVDAIPAMILSFKACLINTLPFLVYGILVLIFTILAAIPLMLGFLIFMPMFIASVYIAYKDCLAP